MEMFASQWRMLFEREGCDVWNSVISCNQRIWAIRMRYDKCAHIDMRPVS